MCFFELFYNFKMFRLKNNNENSIVFIIGAPRTGSTILYQNITNYYDVNYIDNLSSKFYKNLRFGVWLSNLFFKGRPHNSFRSEYGGTTSDGLHAPSECGSFWYRWLPIDRHFVDFDDIEEDWINQISEELNGVIRYYNKPFVIKNLNAGQRLRLISKVFPDAKFVFLRRDPRFVVNSIVSARKRLNVKEEEWWSIKPKNYKELLALPENDLCTAQVFYLENQILEDLKLFPSENIFTLYYNDLSEDIVKKLGEWASFSLRKGGSLEPFKKDRLERFDAKTLNKLNDLVSNYSFSKELFVEK